MKSIPPPPLGRIVTKCANPMRSHSPTRSLRATKVPVYAIPGNHDWYDGLLMFLAFFCRKKPWHIGGWRTRQRRSYFALRVTEKWWIWCIDIQLANDMDQPQADY